MKTISKRMQEIEEELVPNPGTIVPDDTILMVTTYARALSQAVEERFQAERKETNEEQEHLIKRLGRMEDEVFGEKEWNSLDGRPSNEIPSLRALIEALAERVNALEAVYPTQRIADVQAENERLRETIEAHKEWDTSYL